MAHPEPDKSNLTSKRPWSGGLLSWFAANPLVGLVSFLVGLISLGVTVYFGLESLRTRKLSLFVNTTKTTIVKSGQSSDLRVLYRGLPVTSDVTALQVAVWNAGKEPIRAEHFLTSITLETFPKVPILEVRIRQLTRPETQFVVKNDHVLDGRADLSWKILEHDDGALLEFIVAGDTSTIIVPKGAIEGQRSIAIVERGRVDWIGYLAFLTIAFGMPAIEVLGRRRKWEQAEGIRTWITSIMTLIMLVLVGGGAWWLRHMFSAFTPFDF